MSTKLGCVFISTCITPDNKLFTVKYAFTLETLIYWELNFTNNINFQSLEVVYRGSETQLQVTENLNCMAQRSKGLGDRYVTLIPLSAITLQNGGDTLASAADGGPTWNQNRLKARSDLTRQARPTTKRSRLNARDCSHMFRQNANATIKQHLLRQLQNCHHL